MILDGKNIVSFGIHYESFVVRDDKGNVYFLKENDIKKALQQVVFRAQKKRTRTHLTPLEPENPPYLARTYKRAERTYNNSEVEEVQKN